MSTFPVTSGLTKATLLPMLLQYSAVFNTEGCSASDVISAPSVLLMAMLLLSVAPDVKNISSGSAPIRAAARSLATFTALRASYPMEYRAEAFP